MTPKQRTFFAIFVAFMIVDVVVTSIGAIYYPGFTEGNPLFSQFIHDIPTFIFVIVISKGVVIAFVLWLISNLNANKHEYYATVVAMTSGIFMACAIGVLACVNLIMLL